MQKLTNKNPKYTKHLCECVITLLHIASTYDLHRILSVVQSMNRISTSICFLCDCSMEFFSKIGDFIISQVNEGLVVDDNLLISIAKCFVVLIKMEIAKNKDLAGSRKFLKNILHKLCPQNMMFELIDRSIRVCQLEEDGIALLNALNKIK